MSDGNGATIEQLVARQRPGFTLEQPFYIDREVFDFDLERIVMRQWLFVDHISRIPDAGDYILYKIASEEIILVRDAAGTIHAHFNVCRHRGSRICLEAAGNIKNLTCPYHAWTYALDGRLTAARRMPDGFDADDYPLHRCHLRIYQGLMFINLSEGAPTDFDVIARNLDPFVVPHGIPRTKIVHVERYPTDGNWKLVVENFRECYHCPPAHPEYTRVNAYVRANDADPDGYAETIDLWDEKTAAMGHMVGSVHDNTDLPEQPHGAFRQPIREGYLTLSKGGKQVGPLIGDFERFDGGEMMAFFGPLFYVYAANDHVCLFRFTPMTPTHTDVGPNLARPRGRGRGRRLRGRSTEVDVGRHHSAGHAHHRQQPGWRELAPLFAGSVCQARTLHRGLHAVVPRTARRRGGLGGHTRRSPV